MSTNLITDSLKNDQVRKAVNALFQYRQKQEKKDAFLDDAEDIHLQLTFKMVPDVKNQVIKIPLPKTLMQDNTGVCLFVKDLDKDSRDFDKTVDHFKDLFSTKGITNIAEVIPLKMLKLEYSPYEAKRNLSNMYDIFLADERIMHLLPSELGKNFYGRKRHPYSVDLLASNLKHELDRVLDSTRLIISGRGSRIQLTVAHSNMTEEEVVANVMAAYDCISKKLPGGVANIRNMHLRFQNSPQLPIYVSSGGKDSVKLPEPKRKIDEDEPEEVSTIMHKKVKITSEGKLSFYSLDGKCLTKEPNKPARRERKTISQKLRAKRKSGLRMTQQKKPSNKVNRLKPKVPISGKGLGKNKNNLQVKSVKKTTLSDQSVPAKTKSNKLKVQKVPVKRIMVKKNAVVSKPKRKKMRTSI